MVLAGASATKISDDEAEAIAFFLLFNLLIGTNLYTVFQQLGAIQTIQTRFGRVVEAVRLFDGHFADHLFVELNIQPLCFCFPWVSLLFAQSLELRDLLHLWDHLLIFNQNLVDFVMMLSAAYLLFRKKVLMKMNYEEAMAELQTSSEMNFMTLLRIAHQLWDQFNGRQG
jgi:hypothetical protein